MEVHHRQKMDLNEKRAKMKQAVEGHLSSLNLDIEFPDGLLEKLTFRELARFLTLHFDLKGELKEEGLNIPDSEVKIAETLKISRSEAVTLRNLDGSGIEPIRTQNLSLDNYLEIEAENKAFQEQYKDFISSLQKKLSSHKHSNK